MNEVIFNSRKASDVYASTGHYRSGNFSVPPGSVAVVELTTAYDLFDKVVFTAIRTPLGLGVNCYDMEGIGKRYTQTECGSSINSVTNGKSNTTYTPYRKSVWRLGNDKYNGKVFEHRHILRPGNYYLIADKDSNQVISDCAVPTIIEVSIIPVQHVMNIFNTCNAQSEGEENETDK